MRIRKMFLAMIPIFLIMIVFSLCMQSYAANITPFTLRIEEYRKANSSGNQYGYKILDNELTQKVIWKITKVDSSSNSTYADTIYCLKAEQGFMNRQSSGSYEDTYNYSLNMKSNTDKTLGLDNTYLTGSNTYYYKLLWILDHAYMPESTTAQEDKVKLLTNAGLSVEGSNKTLLTDDDIDVVQQMAIWYFTNSDSVYHNDYNGSPLLKALQVREKSNPSTVIDIETITYRQTDAQTLYEYFINSANANASQYEINGNDISLPSPVKLEDTQVTCELNSAKTKYIVGPYKITSTGEYTNFVANFNTTGYTILNASKVETERTIEEMMGQNFYISIPVENITTDTQITLNVSAKYADNSLAFYTKLLDPDNVQPVVKVEKGEKEYRASKTTELLPWKFELVKVDKDTQSIMPGVKFDITTILGGIKSYTTNSSGKIEISNVLGVGVSDEITIIIKEKETLEAYELNSEVITIKLKRNANGTVSVVGNLPSGVTIDTSNRTIKVKVENEKKVGKYNLELLKVDKDSNNPLSDAKFKIEKMDMQGNVLETYNNQITNSSGILSILNIPIKEVGTYKYRITEIEAPPNYDLLTTPIEVLITTSLVSGEYVATGSLVGSVEGISLNNTTGTIKVTVENKLKSGIYSFEILKLEKGSNNPLKNAKFKIEVYEGQTLIKTYNDQLTNANGKIIISNIEITKTGSYTYVITETQAPEKYIGINEPVYVTVVITEKDGEYIVNAELEQDTLAKKIEIKNNVVTVSIENSKFDLALRKFITAINGVELVDSEGKYVREPIVDVSGLKNKTASTATYNHSKLPVSIKSGDKVVYTIRVYNEGQLDGYASQITDFLPAQLEFVNIGIGATEQEIQNDINSTYGWIIESGTNGRVIKTDSLKKDGQLDIVTGARPSGSKLLAYDGGDKLDYIDLKVECIVKNNVNLGDVITNIAAITKDSDENGKDIIDIDSEPETITIPNDENLPTYKDDETTKPYVPGQQDDDDFEKLIVEEFDLSLRKYISRVLNGGSSSDAFSMIGREPSVDTSKLNTIDGNGKLVTTAVYNHSKEPINVKKDDYVEYTIRVYNEGSINGYVEEIVDHLPPELEYVDNEFNKTYGWKEVEESNGRKYKTVYLSKQNSSSQRDNLLERYDKEQSNSLDYKEVRIQCKVKETVKSTGQIITNIAEITKATDESGVEIVDRDSTPNSLTNDNSKQQDKIANDNLPVDKDLPTYKENETASYVPGQQDDDDFEKIKLVYFDLALRKFITKVNDKNVTNRIPTVQMNEDAENTNEMLKYVHTKDPVEVENNDIVTYTIRIYNEGLMAGYASEIIDDMPQGLEYLPEHETNIQYEWELSEDGKSITTDYLSKEKETDTRKNLLKAFDFTSEIRENDPLNPDYKDVKIAFRVIEPNTSDRIIINTAEISKHTDSTGSEVEDIDSTPGNNNEWNKEDDLDKEFIKVKYFDLALRKWVTQAIIIENGKETIVETGHKAEDNPEAIVKVDLEKRDINKITVKFKYKIRIENQGEIAGYAKEIKDYIPAGLKFIAEENKQWYQVSDNVVVTNALQNTLLQPGETAEVEILLTWINSQDNMELKINTAEISKDYNDSNTPDIDSTPDNKKEGEDDIDDAPVMLAIKTGSATIYFTLIGVILVTVAGGVFLIKKYVI